VPQLDIHANLSLDRDLSVEEVRFSGEAGSDYTHSINLNGYRMTVGAGGISSVIDIGNIYGPGKVTSSVDYLNIYTIYSAKNYNMGIYSEISDNNSHKVGVNIMGKGGLNMIGTEGNTFTGDVNIEGSKLILQKKNGAIAVKGNINVKNGGVLIIAKNHQIDNSSTITLNSNRIDKSSLIEIGSYESKSTFTEKIGSLVVDGYGMIKFRHNEWSDRGYFYLNDLIINPDSIIQVEEWLEGYSHLLVRKDSKHLNDAWNKIRFKNTNGEVGVRDYDNDYWEIGVGADFRPLPEPTTYGAALGAVGLGLWLSRRRPLPPLGKLS